MYRYQYILRVHVLLNNYVTLIAMFRDMYNLMTQCLIVFHNI